MYRVLTPAAVLAAAIALAACGSSNSNDDSGAPARANTIEAQRVNGVGDVLVDASGHALYTPDQEADGKIRCTDGCTSFWLPLRPGAGMPTAADEVGPVDVIRRPDGTRQVTLNTKPLYTFSEDAPGKVTGDGFKDEFDGRSFTWRVLLANGGKSDGGSGSGSGAYGY
jgi:predicted lipoprotein with Yx(FWY)xxD motif